MQLFIEKFAILRLLLIAIFCIIGLQVTAHPTAKIDYLLRWDDSIKVEKQNAYLTTQFAIASVGKTMTATAILKLAESGKVALDDPARRYLSPKVVNGLDGLRDVTVRHLLAMSSGLPDYYDGSFVNKVMKNPDGSISAQDAVAQIFGESPNFTPGTKFEYSNTNYVLLGLIIENITGETYAKAMTRLVLAPAGMKDSFVFGSRPLPDSFATGHKGWGRHVRDYYQSIGFGDGGIIATAPDVARFYRALFGEQTLLSADSLAQMRVDPYGMGYGLGIGTDGDFVGHQGSDLGFNSDVGMDLSNGNIRVILKGRP